MHGRPSNGKLTLKYIFMANSQINNYGLYRPIIRSPTHSVLQDKNTIFNTNTNGSLLKNKQGLPQVRDSNLGISREKDYIETKALYKREI